MAANDESVLKMFMRLETNLEEVAKKAEGGFSKLKDQMNDINKAMELVGVQLLTTSEEGAAKLSDHLENQRKMIYTMNKDLETRARLSRLEAEHAEKLIENMGKRFKMSTDEINEWKESIQDLRDAQKDTKSQKEFERALISANSKLDNIVNKDFDKFTRRVKEVGSGFSELNGLVSGLSSSFANIFGAGDILSPAIKWSKAVFSAFKKFFVNPVFGNLKEIFAQKIKEKLRIKALEDGRTVLYKKDLQVNTQLLKILLQQTKEKQNAVKLAKQEAAASKGRKSSGKAKSAEDMLLRRKRPPVSGAGGGAGGGGSINSLLGGGGMGGRGMAAALAASAAVTAAIGAIAVAVGVVVAVIATYIKAMTEASKVMEEFHTINFELSGGQRELAMTIGDIAIKGQYLVKEIQGTVKALGEWGFTANQLQYNNRQLIRTTVAFARVTGVADEVVARHYKTQLALGNTLKETNTQLGYAMVLMKKYGLTASDVTSILQATNDLSHKLIVAFDYTPGAASRATMAMGKLGAAAKQLGIDVSEAASFYRELTDNAMKYIVATGGKSLFQGPTETLADLMRQQDSIMRNVNKLPVAMRSQFLQQLYGLNEKQIRMLGSMKEEHLKWAEAEKKAAIMRGESLGKLDLSEEKFLKAADKADSMIDNVENLARKSNENLTRQMEIIKDKFLGVLIKVGAQIMPFIIDVFDYVMTTYDTILGWFADLLGRRSEKDMLARQAKRDELLGIKKEFLVLADQIKMVNAAKTEQILLEKQAKQIRADMVAGDKAAESQLEDVISKQKAWARAVEELETMGVKGEAISEYDLNRIFKEAQKEEQRLAREAEARERRLDDDAIASKANTDTMTARPEEIEEKTKGATPTRYAKEVSDLERTIRGMYNKDADKILSTQEVADEVAKLQGGQISQLEALNAIKTAVQKRKMASEKSDAINWN